MVLNAIFNNIAVISWWSVLLVDERYKCSLTETKTTDKHAYTLYWLQHIFLTLNAIFLAVKQQQPIFIRPKIESSIYHTRCEHGKFYMAGWLARQRVHRYIKTSG